MLNKRLHRVIEVGNLLDIARGAAFLGAGGGGDPYIGYLVSKSAILEFGPPTIIPLAELDDDATVVSNAMIARPLSELKKLFRGMPLSERCSGWKRRQGAT